MIITIGDGSDDEKSFYEAYKKKNSTSCLPEWKSKLTEKGLIICLQTKKDDNDLVFDEILEKTKLLGKPHKPCEFPGMSLSMIVLPQAKMEKGESETMLLIIKPTIMPLKLFFTQVLHNSQQISDWEKCYLVT